MWVYDVASLRFLAVNDAAVVHYGYSREEFLGMTIKDIRPPSDVPALLKDVAQRAGGLSAAEVWRHRRRSGDIILVEIQAHSLPFEGHDARLVMATDVTQQREAQARLRRQAALLDQATDAIFVTGVDGVITYWNEGARRLYGWTAEEALGRQTRELLGQDPDFAEELRLQLRARREWRATTTETCKNGRTVTVDGRWTLLSGDGGEGISVLAIKTDVTQRLELEARLRQAQRLEAVGHLTGGVAHDFNNLLTVILGNADLMAEQLADQPALLPLAEITRAAAQRGAELTHRLLAFARRQPLQPQVVDVHQLLAGMDGLLRRALNEDIEIELVRGAGLWPALVDAAQLESALLNLALNARDAMPGGGKLTLETANAWIDQDYADHHGEVQPGQYVMISVSDSGSGIAPEHLARVFEPFFTTKGPGKGSGLGLSMVYGFVKQSHGHIKLYSEQEQGTTARVYLPRAGGSPDAPVAPAAPQQAPRRGAWVLVVEDDDLVRRFARDQLLSLGYDVVTAENGVQALEILRQRSDIELLFTDVVMPGGLSGRQLAEQALALHPGLKVLYTSGYTENAIVHQGRLDRGVHLLNKPYRRDELARKVRAALASPE